MKRLKQMMAAGTATTMLLASTLNVSAAGLKDIFDAQYYADSYADLKETFGNDEKQLYQHFVTYGLKEGRNMSPILDVAAYREAYGDLDAAFGDNWDAYVDHFLTFGAYEMRDKGVLFNPVSYAAAYGDISAAFGDDLMAITRHYLTFGKSENRTQGTSNGYADIAAAKQAAQAAAQAATQAAARPDKPSVTYSAYGGRTEYKYDDRGNCIESIEYNSYGGMMSHSYSSYNSNDDIVYYEMRDSEGKLRGYTKYEYDGKKLQKATRHNGSGNITSYSTYEWNGNQVKILDYNASGEMTGYSECETDSRFNFTKVSRYDAEGNLESFTVKTYDNNDNVLTYVDYDADGTERVNVTFTYYANDVQKTVVEIYDSIKNIREYNENGGQVSGIQYKDGELVNKTTYEYSAEGPIAKSYSESYSSNGAIFYREVAYDKQGKMLIENIWNTLDGKTSYKGVCEYSGDGSHTWTNEGYDLDGTLTYKSISVYNTQNEQVKNTVFSIAGGKTEAVYVTEYENGRVVKDSSYKADGVTLIAASTYTYQETDYGFDKTIKYESADGKDKSISTTMYDKAGSCIGYKYYDADGKLTRKEILDSSNWEKIAVYEYDADGTEIALVKNEYGEWVRPETQDETGSDEGDTGVSGGDAQGSVSGGDAA